ncbi:MAG TPA: 30S ribosome-binding factor RbfA [Spirochaetota bacterium]
MASFRKERIEELIKRMIGDALLSDVKDPRIGFASVFRVEISRDYSVADVFISVIGDDVQKKKTIKGLYSASGYIRSKIGKQLKMRVSPELKFHIDDSIEKGSGMVDLLDKLASEGHARADLHGSGDGDDGKK